MDSIEARLSALESMVAELIAIEMANVGALQALLYGLQAAIIARDPEQGVSEMERRLGEGRDLLLAQAISDDALDQASQARERIGQAILSAFAQAMLPPESLEELRRKGFR